MDVYAINNEIDSRFIPEIDDFFLQKKNEVHSSFFPLALLRLILFIIVCSGFILYRFVTGLFNNYSPSSGAWLIHHWAKVAVFILGVKIQKLGDLPARGSLIVTNHRSYIDAAVTAALMPVSFLAKKELASWPLFGIGARLVNILFVKRDNVLSRRQARKDIQEYLNAGISFHLFPEGTTYIGPGLLPFRPAVFELAANNGFPVVPGAVRYERKQDAWVGNDTFIRHFFQTFSKPVTRVSIVFGPVMSNQQGGKLASDSWQWIHDALATMEETAVEPIKYNLDTFLAKLLYNPYRYELLYRPGQRMSDEALNRLTEKIKDTALTAFESIPDYQVLRGTREEYVDKVLSLAWKSDGTLAGFCSTVILPVEGVGDILHLGLTVVRPEDRSNGLTHILTGKAVKGYLVKGRPVAGKLWISNCAAVLSSLVNVARFFEEVHPSPEFSKSQKGPYERIARAIDEQYRDKIYISDKAVFDSDAFVFRKSVEGTVFKKDADDVRYFHRNRELNDYYRTRMNFHEGDEVLQIGYVTVFTALRHMYEKTLKDIRGMAGKRSLKKSA